MMKNDYIWLNKYKILLENKNVLEMGCGEGIDSKVIAEYTSCLIASDIDCSKNYHEKKVVFDHSSSIPFKSDTFDVVVASLCLHYFSSHVTKYIFSEISRVTKKNGHLICRLNSDQDQNYGAGEGYEIEKGLFLNNGQQKKFFTETDIIEVVGGIFCINQIQHKEIDRYNKPKYIYEFTAKNA